MKIKILDESVSSRIAAGEIIDRPASVIRELIDNSIDAGATEITIQLTSGGIDEITVTDNGCGMDKDDLLLSVYKHSTSKISTIEDLYSIRTMGFRGEALYSINTVSKLTITSGTDKSGMKHGYKIAFYESNSLPVPAASRQGTKIDIRELFYNFPARKKFLKSSVSELNAVKNTLIEKVFSSLHISYSLYNDSKLIFKTPGNGVFTDTFFAVMKNEEQFEISCHTEVINENLKITVYHSDPSIFFPTRKYQYLYVNNRPVTAPFFYTAISNGYSSVISPGRHPLLFVFLDINPESVDVNIHPAKREVKFHDQQLIYDGIFQTVRKGFSSRLKRDLITGHMDTNNCFYEKTENFSAPADTGNRTTTRELYHKIGQYNPLSISDSPLSPPSNELDLLDLYHKKISNENNITTQNTTIPFTRENGLLPDTKIIGVIYDTYIIVEKNDTIYFIDQHAVEEAYIYKMKKEAYTLNSSSDKLIIPIIFELDKINHLSAAKIADLNSAGFLIEENEGESFAIREIPSVLSHAAIDEIIEIIKTYIEEEQISDKNIIDKVLISASCREAVKKGDKLSSIEIRDIIEKFFKFNITNCPHGRPVYFELKRGVLEKNFQRRK